MKTSIIEKCSTKINSDESIIDLLAFFAIVGLLVSGGIFLNHFLSKGK